MAKRRKVAKKAQRKIRGGGAAVAFPSTQKGLGLVAPGLVTITVTQTPFEFGIREKRPGEKRFEA